MAPSDRSAAGDGRAHRRTTPGPPYQLTAGTGRPARTFGGVRRRSPVGWSRAADPSSRGGRPESGRPARAAGQGPLRASPRPGRACVAACGAGTRLHELRSGRAVHDRRALPGRLPGSRGAPADDASWGAPRTRSTRGATARRPSSGRWPATGSSEVRFAGASWFLSGNAGRDPGRLHRRRPDGRVARRVVRGRPPGRPATRARSTRPARRSPGAQAYRLDTLNGESVQTIIDWTVAGRRCGVRRGRGRRSRSRRSRRRRGPSRPTTEPAAALRPPHRSRRRPVLASRP